MDWVVKVVKVVGVVVVLMWLVGVGGWALGWEWLSARGGIQAIMSVVGAAGAIVTGWAAFLAYLQYRDKRYGLSEIEWDILKALWMAWYYDTSLYKVGVYLDDNDFKDHLNEYPKSCGREQYPEHTPLLLKARKIGDTHSNASSPRAEPRKLLVCAEWGMHCRQLARRGYLRLIRKTKAVEEYDLTAEGPRFTAEKSKSLAKRLFMGVDEVEIMGEDIKSWHMLSGGAITPRFLEAHIEKSGGVEFPHPFYKEDNPCGVWYLLVIVPRGHIDIDEIGNRLGIVDRLNVKKPTTYLSPDSQFVDAVLKYFHVEDESGQLVIEMWYGGIGPMLDIVGGSRRKEWLRKERKKIEETYYPSGSLDFPDDYINYKSRRGDEKFEEMMRRFEWLQYRHKPLRSRYRRRVSHAWSRLWRGLWRCGCRVSEVWRSLWSRLKLLAKRDKAD